MRRWFQKRILPIISNDIGIDLGTANTLVYLRGRGIVVNEPSVVAVNQKTNQVVAVGEKAKQMLGRTPGHLSAVRPLVDGVVSDFEATEEMLAYLINRAQGISKKILGPRAVVGVPSGITNVEMRAVRDASLNAGAREVHIVEEPIAAALGIRLPLREAVGSMLVDIGGGTTDIAVLSLGGIVRSKNLRIAGDKLNQDIISYIRSEFKILVGEKTAEAVKMAIGSVSEGAGRQEALVRGRDLITGLPREVVLADGDIREAISQSIDTLVESVREVLETTPPEILSDIMRGGVVLVGGGAMLHGLDTLLAGWLKVPVIVADDPLTAVARGTGVILENLDLHSDMLIDHEDDFE
ncbi:rod shape-determining protein [Candidatus Adlerbacteria bacterium RIFCSPHIGHO2_01_FULL_54_23]|uniref:Cell shape-determining protein MreB n=3 Tax=Candidatus Adleribacteriota TaxID=1752736 RepID=A0A1F4Y2K8_9BACT|nr:MAG: cell shape determining protein, MreB/Mrl family [Candidatus Adlerbacteria bacterium GW2011_GWA1_54_10]KKW37922.1 MAG: cell shape determining protein, MreB/Mrl family [Candidatus Adlerbacteria bacterium GW2011_GWB1_54_7]OGC78533.1 MAG: rod shape-determining protein [Candidatus Adlerbacteria bacterium RIFCSPHIGHO2_01_FULL_54_23]OGC87543.1 MAG: rod shape-determining protein [Candidatus Adlerbacteria bacterium RIFCSPLOWO2_01_FULL_54_16]